jgi:hypothetical protein
MENLNERTYNTVLSETSDFFAAQGLSIIGEGYKEIATNAALFQSYVENLTEGASADHAAVMAQLMANTNTGILKESSMTGIQPIASLSMPVIRKLWPKFALKDALKTEVAKSPRFVVSYTKPYMVKGDEKVELVKGIAGYSGKPEADSDIHDSLKKEFTRAHVVELAAGEAKVLDFKFQGGVTLEEGHYTAADLDEHVVVANTPSNIKVQPLDELVLEAYHVAGPLASLAAAGEEGKSYVVWDARFLRGSKIGGVPTHDGLGVCVGAEAKAGDKAAEIVSSKKLGKRLSVYGSQVYDLGDGCQLLVQFDGKSGKATFAALGGAVALTCYAGVSSEYNEESWSVGFDIARQDIDIPTGQHINAPLPIEALNDMMALYQIDGTKETVDLMTNIFAMKLDLEILDFIRDSLANRPSNEAFQEGYGEASGFCLTFDCKPAAGFAGSPKAWREEIKPMIDHLAQKIKNETYLQAGVFTIVGNPIDVQILANVDWSFRGGQGGNMDGVEVDYSIGTYVGANAYKVIASTQVPQGALYILFTPSGETQMTYKYYPYTFSTEMGYVDPNRSRVPSIMMTKRHTMYEFMPAIGAIVIENNNGAWFHRGSFSGADGSIVF